MLPAEVLMGQLYEASGEHKLASQFMARAIKNSSDDLQTRLAAAEWALRTNELAKAKADAEAIAKLDADALGTSLLMGSIARVERKLPEAEHYFELAHLKSPGNFAATNSLALVLAEQPEEAPSICAPALKNLLGINAEKYARIPRPGRLWLGSFSVWNATAMPSLLMERKTSAFLRYTQTAAFYLGTMLERRGRWRILQAVLEKALPKRRRHCLIETGVDRICWRN